MRLSAEEFDALVAIKDNKKITNSDLLKRLQKLGLATGLVSVATLQDPHAVITGIDTELTDFGKLLVNNHN